MSSIGYFIFVTGQDNHMAEVYVFDDNGAYMQHSGRAGNWNKTKKVHDKDFWNPEIMDQSYPRYTDKQKLADSGTGWRQVKRCFFNAYCKAHGIPRFALPKEN